MEPWTADFLMGLAVNAASGALSRTFQGMHLRTSFSARSPALAHLAQTSRDLLQLKEMLPDHSAKNLERFLKSKELARFTERLFAAFVAIENQHQPNHHKELAGLLKLYLPEASPHYDHLAQLLIDGLMSVFEEVGEEYLPRPFRVLENVSAARQQVIRQQLASIEQNTQLLLKGHLPSIDEIDLFDSKYRSQVEHRHRWIVPPHFDTAEKLSFEDIYVTPDLEFPPFLRVKGTEWPRIFDRTVILGNPGAGKSTFANKLCLTFSTNPSLPTPVLVVLREFGPRKAEAHLSIKEYIEELIRARYQVPAPEGAIEYMLFNGRLMIIFDGLDELLDTSHRREIAEDVESFCNLYQGAWVLVTSREVGYEQAPLNQRFFMTGKLLPFSEDKVQEYAMKWFVLNSGLDPAASEERAQHFIRESRAAPDIRSNPLMLALMCNIYRGENYIPSNRPDLYEKCAIMLFERWDKSRDIEISLPFEAHLRPAVSFIAYEIFSDSTLQGGMTERRLVAAVADYLQERRFEERDEAVSAAREFIDFCSGRAWVLTDLGTTAAGEKLFQFTHRTFLEYFTAFYLARTLRSPKDLLETLIPRITAGEWDVVAELAVQLKARSLEDAADDILELIMEDIGRLPTGAAFRRLSFAARALQFLVPRPATTRMLTTRCLDAVIKRVTGFSSSGGRTWSRLRTAEVVVFLLTASPENFEVIASSLLDTIESGLSARSLRRRRAAAEVALSFPWLQRGLAGGYIKQKSSTGYRAELTLEAIAKNRETFLSLAESDANLAYGLYLAGHLNIGKLISLHGIGIVTQRFVIRISEVRLPSLAELTMDRFFIEDDSISGPLLLGAKRLEESIEEVAPLLTSAILSIDAPDRHYVVHSHETVYSKAWKKLGGDTLYVALLLCCIAYELPHHYVTGEVRAKLFGVGANPAKIKRALVRRGLRLDQVEQLIRWRDGQAAFVIQPPGQ